MISYNFGDDRWLCFYNKNDRGDTQSIILMQIDTEHNIEYISTIHKYIGIQTYITIEKSYLFLMEIMVIKYILVSSDIYGHQYLSFLKRINSMCFFIIYKDSRHIEFIPDGNKFKYMENRNKLQINVGWGKIRYND